jgi:hypothetical protein
MLMALFFSENMKGLLREKEKSWKMPLRLKKVFKDILKRRSRPYEIREYAYDFFKVITPEYVLKKLNQEDPSKFNINPEVRDPGYFNTLYLPNLTEYLGVEKKLHLDAKRNPNGTCNLYYSNIYNNYKINTVKDEKGENKKNPKYRRLYDLKPLSPKEDQNLELVTIRFSDEDSISQNLYKENVNLFSGNVNLGGHSFVTDSVLLTNFNISHCKLAHDIAGITCDGKRYIYNGWVRTTKDRAMKGGAMGAYPCELMEYDWMKDNKDFCLNLNMCKLDPIGKKELGKRVCFNPMKGERTYILIRKEDPKDSEKGTNETKENVIDAKKRKTKEEVKDTNGKGKGTEKACPDGKIVNPVTRRCVKIDGAIGKKISKGKI